MQVRWRKKWQLYWIELSCTRFCQRNTMQYRCPSDISKMHSILAAIVCGLWAEADTVWRSWLIFRTWKLCMRWTTVKMIQRINAVNSIETAPLSAIGLEGNFNTRTAHDYHECSASRSAHLSFKRSCTDMNHAHYYFVGALAHTRTWIKQKYLLYAKQVQVKRKITVWW